MRCPCREDDSRVWDRTAARNLAILRKIAVNLISRGRTAWISMRVRRKQAAWNDEYMIVPSSGLISCVAPGDMSNYGSGVNRSRLVFSKERVSSD